MKKSFTKILTFLVMCGLVTQGVTLSSTTRTEATAAVAKPNIATYYIDADGNLAVTGKAPRGSTFKFTRKSYTAHQYMAGETFTITLSGYNRYTIKELSLMMSSNKETGAGQFVAKVGADKILCDTGVVPFSYMNNGQYAPDRFKYLNIPVTEEGSGGENDILNRQQVKAKEDVTFTLTSTENSLYFDRISVTYTTSVDYQVKFETNKQFKITSPNPLVAPRKQEIAEPTYVKEKNTYIEGWYTTPNFEPSTKFDFVNDVVTSDLVLYAKKADENLVTFDYNYEGAPAPQSLKTKYGYCKVVPIPQSRTNFTFVDWCTDASCRERFDSKKKIEGPITVYAKWVDQVDYNEINPRYSLGATFRGTQSDCFRKITNIKDIVEGKEYYFGNQEKKLLFDTTSIAKAKKVSLTTFDFASDPTQANQTQLDKGTIMFEKDTASNKYRLKYKVGSGTKATTNYLCTKLTSSPTTSGKDVSNTSVKADASLFILSFDSQGGFLNITNELDRHMLINPNTQGSLGPLSKFYTGFPGQKIGRDVAVGIEVYEKSRGYTDAKFSQLRARFAFDLTKKFVTDNQIEEVGIIFSKKSARVVDDQKLVMFDKNTPQAKIDEYLSRPLVFTIRYTLRDTDTPEAIKTKLETNLSLFVYYKRVGETEISYFARKDGTSEYIYSLKSIVEDYLNPNLIERLNYLDVTLLQQIQKLYTLGGTI